MCRFVKESLRFAHRAVQGSSEFESMSRDVVRLFVGNGCKSPPRKSDVIFVDAMGSTYTHSGSFHHGVDEHPNFGP